MIIQNPDALAFEDLLDLVTPKTVPHIAIEIDRSYCKKNRIDPDASDKNFYVPPTLSRKPDSAILPPFVLISAPAAVGKTRLARELQRHFLDHDRCALYVPLQGRVIGDNFFSGLLADIFPNHPKVNILSALFSGKLVLIFDGYDEISMTSQQVELNRRFSDEISGFFEAAPQTCPPCIFFLFRSVFERFGIFEPLSSRSTQLSVNFFDRDKQKEYISQYVSAKNDKFKLPPTLVDKFLDAFYFHLSRASEQASFFFGHAIVLSSFGDYLISQQEGNALKLANRISKGDVNEETSVDILCQIIDDILEREVNKFPAEPFRQTIPEFHGYTIELQAELLREVATLLLSANDIMGALKRKVSNIVSRELGSSPAFAALSSEQQSNVRNALTQEIGGKIEHHPFLDVDKEGRLAFRNPIYQEFYLARMLANVDDTRLAEQVMQKNGVSYYLALFLLASVNKRIIPDEKSGLLFYLITLLASAAKNEEPRILMRRDASKNQWEVSLESSSMSLAPFFVNSEFLILEMPNGGILRNFEIIDDEMPQSEADVAISGPANGDERSSQIALVDGVIVSANVEICATRVDFSSVYIECSSLKIGDQVSRATGLETVEVVAGNDFKLQCSDFASNAWGENLRPIARGRFSDVGEFQAYLSKILLWFRRHGRDTYGVYEKRFNTVVLKKGADPVAQKVVNFLFEEALLSRVDELIVLDQALAGAYGIFYRKQNEISFDAERFAPLYSKWSN